ncbi:hypothetical protein ASF22_02525 [Methylobacterium sp. Leaf87]|uniref:DUF2312 domain-containing protein n=1 Tax=Methylobacterium sp. Leaf87 TaxID=1736243 RepID=UPI0006F63C19|nr:DUF2312 domain-containing protein [Methylobacterium sp. Leaf87]KQO69503.1 hypothetical protein ASF22_02525 [Methylobacterium sp. Leaf87]
MTDSTPGPGHNSVSADQLKSFIERVESVDSEIADRQSDRREILAEAKGSGFDTAAIRKLIQIRKQDRAERQEQQAILEMYAQALGMGDVFA